MVVSKKQKIPRMLQIELLNEAEKRYEASKAWKRIVEKHREAAPIFEYPYFAVAAEQGALITSHLKPSKSQAIRALSGLPEIVGLIMQKGGSVTFDVSSSYWLEPILERLRKGGIFISPQVAEKRLLKYCIDHMPTLETIVESAPSIEDLLREANKNAPDSYNHLLRRYPETYVNELGMNVNVVGGKLMMVAQGSLVFEGSDYSFDYEFGPHQKAGRHGGSLSVKPHNWRVSSMMRCAAEEIANELTNTFLMSNVKGDLQDFAAFVQLYLAAKVNGLENAAAALPRIGNDEFIYHELVPDMPHASGRRAARVLQTA